MKILISAGHTNKSGSDRGAAGNGFIEGVEATKLRDKTAKYLKELDSSIQVIEDGADGINDPLKKAVALAKGADKAVEFHFNAGAKTATGIEVLAKPRHKKLAQKLANAIHEATGLKLRGESGYKADNSGQHHRLAFCEAGGLIIEVCFISNPSDMKAYQENFDAICLGIAEVLSNKSSAATSLKTKDNQTALTPPIFVTGLSIANSGEPDTGAQSEETTNPQAPETTQNAEQITNIDQSSNTVPDNFVSETKVVEAPAKENSTATAAKLTIGGFAVPTFLVVVIQTVKDLTSQGFINAQELGSMLLGFIRENTRYVFYLIGLIIIGLLLKKAYKQITLWIQMYFAGRADTNDVEVKPQ